MTKVIKNLMLPCIAGEIEDILDGYDHHPYQQAYAAPELRQKLLVYVLNAIPAFYVMMEEAEDFSQINWSLLPPNFRQRLRLSIIQGIQQITEENSTWISHHIPIEPNAGLAPSNWFG